MELVLYTEGFFDAAHFIRNHEGKCAHLHGHTWKIALWIKGDEAALDEKGILWDFGNMKKLTDTFDHKNLNEVITENPTAEWLVLTIFKMLKTEYPELSFKVRVYENVVSKTSYCEGGDFT